MEEKELNASTTKSAERSAVIVRTSVIGIATNLLLVAFKAAVGLLSNSIAIIMDAVNNLSDAASSIITIVGTKLAGKRPDRKHPFGHGRAEYLAAMIISILVLYAGITAFIESLKKIITPEVPDYGAATLIIVGAGVAAKIILGLYVKRTGKKVNSDSLVNSGQDALLDSVISAATLVAAVIYLTLHISLEAWLGAIIAVVIVKSGIEMLIETLSKILGERPDAELAREIKKTINSYPEISGCYDLIMHDYGPDRYNASVHVEVADTMTADELDKLIRRISVEIYHKLGVILTAVGVYSVNTKDPEAIEARNRIEKIVFSNEHVIQMHGFYIDYSEKSIRFDVIISFDDEDRNKTYQQIVEGVSREFPDFSLQVAMDTDFSEE